MTLELVVTSANLLAIIGYAMRMEGRLARLEALVEALRERRS